MTKADTPKPKNEVVIRHDSNTRSALKRVGGSTSDVFNNILANDVFSTLWTFAGCSDENRNNRYNSAVSALMAFKPQDEIEGMMAAQAVAMHHASMECSRRAMLREQPFECAQGFRKAAVTASRAFIEIQAALDRKRGKSGQQKVTVEHVHVYSGGQAIVGPVTGGGGGSTGQTEAEPRASPSRLAHDATFGAVIPPVRGTDTQREPVQICSDGKRSVSNARRRQHRSTDG